MKLLFCLQPSMLAGCFFTTLALWLLDTNSYLCPLTPSNLAHLVLLALWKWLLSVHPGICRHNCSSDIIDPALWTLSVNYRSPIGIPGLENNILFGTFIEPLGSSTTFCYQNWCYPNMLVEGCSVLTKVSIDPIQIALSTEQIHIYFEM